MSFSVIAATPRIACVSKVSMDWSRYKNYQHAPIPCCLAKSYVECRELCSVLIKGLVVEFRELLYFEI